MSFKSNGGVNVSYDCSSLIEELREDIAEFGSNLILEVVVEDVDGVTIYKDYNFIEDDPSTEFELEPGERLIRMTAAALMTAYEVENQVL